MQFYRRFGYSCIRRGWNRSVGGTETWDCKAAALPPICRRSHLHKGRSIRMKRPPGAERLYAAPFQQIKALRVPRTHCWSHHFQQKNRTHSYRNIILSSRTIRGCPLFLSAPHARERLKNLFRSPGSNRKNKPSRCCSTLHRPTHLTPNRRWNQSAR